VAGIAEYARATGLRHLFGCCSLTSQEPRDGLLLLEQLVARGAMHDGIRVRARAEHRCLATLPRAPLPEVEVPRLFDMYLALGARVCSEPAIDRAFRTIDFLVLFDLDALSARDRRRFLPDEATGR
jgi:putative hemolysin